MGLNVSLQNSVSVSASTTILGLSTVFDFVTITKSNVVLVVVKNLEVHNVTYHSTVAGG